jgi:ankyrin repeat protein
MSEALLEAIHAKDADRVTAVLAEHPDLASRLNQPLPGLHFGATALSEAVGLGNRAMIDALLQAGADINARSDWWAGSFGVLDFVDADLAEFLISRGAVLDLHVAARLAWVDRVRELIATDPSRVHARGGDGQTPLHRAGSLEVARILIDAGADINARDVDHESTPAQYQVREHPEIARDLVERGCTTDLLLLTALSDLPRVRALLDAQPEAIHTAVDDESFPKRNPRSGGTIYQWTLGAHWNAHRVAREFGHPEFLALLMERSPRSLQLGVACEVGDDERIRSLLAAHPDLPKTLTRADLRRLPGAARNADWGAVRRMVDAGWPLDARGQHGGMVLHWAAWHGSVEMARELTSRGAPLDAKDHDFGGTPLTWAAHASVDGWHPDRGDHAGVVEALLDAGATPPSPEKHSGSESVRAVLKRRS